MPALNVREVPEELIQAVRHAAVDAKMTMKDWVLWAISEKLGKQEEPCVSAASK